MTEAEYYRLVELSLDAMVKTGAHWFRHQFITVPHHLFAASIIRSCASIDRVAPTIGTTLLLELATIGGRDLHESHYEQLMQKLSEILVIERIVSANWPQETKFDHEPCAQPNGPRPELLVTTPTGRLVVEVKTPSLLRHIRNTFARRADGQPLTFPNVDCVVALRHLHYFMLASRGEQMDRSHAMDFGQATDVPNVSFDLANGRAVPQPVLDQLRARRYDDPGLKTFAEYNPQDLVLWVPHSSSHK